MAIIKVESKNKTEVEKKPRVWFTCHPADFDKHFGKICQDIFATHDCAVYYTEDMTAAIAEDEKETDLGRNNLFVVPVTFKLLSTPNRAMDEDIPYALQEHIPVLPFMMEPGLDSIYSRPDKFDALQYLTPNSMDTTEISYNAKLKKYLESVLISDELANRVRAAFDAYIFLSYRKKDRKFANELMRLIHSNPQCRDIAIWFDEFLTPGESFKKNIEKALDDCQLFTLLVTPQLLEKIIDENGVERDNYVISTELPLARRKKEEKGTEILAVEMETTDPEALQAIEIRDYLHCEDDQFKTRLLESIAKVATTENDTPEHNYLIGLAYLDGIDVEVDRERGMKLITAAAEADLCEAMAKLFTMCREGVGFILNYKEAVKWAKRIVEHNKQHYGKGHPNTLTALYDLADFYGDCRKYTKATKLLKKVYALRCKVLGEKHPDVLRVLQKLAYFYYIECKFRRALKWYEKQYMLQCTLLGEMHSDNLSPLKSVVELSLATWKFRKTAEQCEKLYVLQREVLGEEHLHTLATLQKLAWCYEVIRLDDRKALELYERVYELRCKVQGENHTNTLITLKKLEEVRKKLQ